MSELCLLSGHASQLAIPNTKEAGQGRNPVRGVHACRSTTQIIVYPSNSLTACHATVVHTIHDPRKYVSGINRTLFPPVAVLGKDVFRVKATFLRSEEHTSELQ